MILIADIFGRDRSRRAKDARKVVVKMGTAENKFCHDVMEK